MNFFPMKILTPSMTKYEQLLILIDLYLRASTLEQVSQLDVATTTLLGKMINVEFNVTIQK
jgi:hypothetical protein